MATIAGLLGDAVFFDKFGYVPAPILDYKPACLDVFTKVERSLLVRLRSWFSGDLEPFVWQGCMLDNGLLGADSKFTSEELGRLKKGVSELKSKTIIEPAYAEVFKKTELQNPISNMIWKASRGASAWLTGVAGVDWDEAETLSCEMDGLKASSVDHLAIRNWIRSGDWCPDAEMLEMSSVTWSADRREEIRSIWIVTEILYATKFVVKGRNGIFSGVDAPKLFPKFAVNVHNNNELTIEAKRNQQFPVGYQFMRVDYKPNKTFSFKLPNDTGLRGESEDLREANVKWMEEDIFEDDNSGGRVPVPLLTPTKEELDKLRATIKDSKDSVSA